VIRVDPKSGVARYLRGSARYERYMGASAWIEQDDLDRAIADFTEAVRLDPKDAMAFYARGLAWNTNGNPDRAMADFTETIRRDPDSSIAAAAYYNRGLIWNSKGDRDRAIADLIEAVRITPYVPERLAALKQLKPDYTAPSLKEFLGLPPH
jgi:tetratricopeptide (TPR) repeat protein